MRILMIGDIVGRPGRRAVKENVPDIRKEFGISFVIANGENAAGGNGITQETAAELFSCGIDVLTGGNHIWDKKESFAFISGEPRLIRPANYPPGVPGVGYGVYPVDGYKLAVVNLSGRVFMSYIDCPFRKADDILSELSPLTSLIVIDFHAETTSEKIAFGWYLDGRVSAVLGTHTHVQTADERVLPGGTAYITDVWMTGPQDSVIGVKTDVIIDRFLTQLPRRFEVAASPYQFDACVVTLDPGSGKALEIKRIKNFER
jgi:hypothetical protein